MVSKLRSDNFFITVIVLNLILLPFSCSVNSNEVNSIIGIHEYSSYPIFVRDTRHVDNSPFVRYVRVYLWKIGCQCDDPGGINKDVEMFFEVNINGVITRFPSEGYHTLANGDEWEINQYAYEEASLSQNLRFKIHVWDDDFPMPDDDLGELTDIHTPQDNFGDTGNMGPNNCYHRDDGDWSVWYWVEVDDPPGPPILLAPYDNQTFNMSFPAFSWNFNPGDDTTQGAFCAQIDDTPRFSSVEATSGDVESDSTSWVPPGLDDGSWYWRVCTCDSNGAWGNWSESRSFLVDSTPPAVELVSPGGGEVLFGEIEINVRAVDTVSGMDHVDFYYKVDSEYIFIGSKEILDDEGYYSVLWNTSDLAETDTYHVKVVGFNGVRLSSEDRTDRFFEINRPDVPVLELLSPIGGENYTEICEVRWSASDNDPEDSLLFKISISEDPGVTYTNITGWLSEGETLISPALYNYSLDVGPYQNSTLYRIRVCASDSSPLTPDVYDSSGGEFTIYHSVINYPPEVYLTEPLGGRFAFEMPIEYMASDPNRRDNLVIDILFQFEGGEWQLLVANSVNTGEYLWDLEGVPEGRLRLKIIARDGTKEGIWEMVDHSLTVYVNNAPKAVILSPQNVSILTDRTVIFFSSGSYDLDNHSIDMTWLSDLDGVLYEGSNDSFSTTLSIGKHIISLRVTDEYEYSDETRVTVVIRHFEDIYFEDIYVESITFPETALLGAETRINFTLRNDGNAGGRISFVLSVIPLGSDDVSGIGDLTSDTSFNNAEEIFRGIVALSPGEVFHKHAYWTFNEPGFHVIIGIIEDENRSNDLEPAVIEIISEEQGSGVEREQLLVPFFYIYGIIVSLLFLFGTIIIVHRVRRKKGENRAIEKNLISASEKGVNAQFEPMAPVDEPIRERIKVLKRFSGIDDRIGYGSPMEERDISVSEGHTLNRQKSEEKVKTLIKNIMAGFEEGDDLQETKPILTTGTEKTDIIGEGTNYEGVEGGGTCEANIPTLVSSIEKGKEPSLPKRVREIFEGL